MPRTDCGTCDWIAENIKCGMTISADELKVLIAKLLCEIADNTNASSGGGVFSLGSDSRNDTFTAAANGGVLDSGAISLFKTFSIQVVKTGAVTAWDVVLEGSLDGTHYSTILEHTQADGDGDIKAGADFPVRYIRSRLVSITGGTNVKVYITGVLG